MKKTEYDIGEIVYLKTDSEQEERMVTGIQLRPKEITYGLTLCTDETWHFDIEISREKNILKSFN